MWKHIKARLLRTWLWVPFGNICSFKYGEQTVTLRKNLWVIISDGCSQDALPLNFVSQQLIDAVEQEMRRIGYLPVTPDQAPT